MRRSFLASILAALMFAGGCASGRATIGSWQKTLEHYAANECNGDLAFLRDDPAQTPRQQFAVIGDKSADDSTDVTGVLLGRRTIQGRDWFVFLLGGIIDRRVEDVRVALLADGSGKPKWIVTHADRAALATYLKHKESTWQALNPARPQPPPSMLGFPGESDIFELTIAENTITVTETNSGARWTLVLPEPKPQPQNTAASQ